MVIVRNEAITDGSAWVGLVRYGKTGIVSINYIGGGFKVHVPSLKNGLASVKNESLIKEVVQWAEDEVNKLGEEWHTLHNNLYFRSTENG